MRCGSGKDNWSGSGAWWLSCLGLLLALAAGGAVRAQQPAPGAADGKGGGTAAVYRVVNLGDGQLSALPRINAGGQVSFSQFGDAGSRGYFYDGKSTRDIGTLGGLETLATDLNNAGQVTGGSFTRDSGERAFVWSAASGMASLGVLPGGASSRASTINNLGVVTGYSEAGLAPPRAFRWSAADGLSSLGELAPGLDTFSVGNALNDAGLITGAADNLSFERHAFAWTATRGLADIDSLGSSYSEGIAVGAGDEVAGSRVPLDGVSYRAFLWAPGQGMQDLGTADGVESFALAMSRDARIAGLINLESGAQRAMTWTRSGGMRNLGTLGGSDSRAFAVNGAGQVVGYANDRNQSARGFVWTARGGMVDLNTRLHLPPPGLLLDDAIAINDAGAIVATSNAGLVLLTPGKGRRDGQVLGPLQLSALARTGETLQARVAWIDDSGSAMRSASFAWGDGSGAQAGTVRESAGAGSAGASHHFSLPGIYRVTASVTSSSGSTVTVGRTVVVAAPASGTVAGSGKVPTPRGAFRQAPSWTGRAEFGLLVPLTAAARAAGTPAQLRFALPGLDFRSDNVRALGQQGGARVFDGAGRVNGKGEHRFRLSTTLGVAGGGAGRFALRIWRTDPVSKQEVAVYDNSAAAARQLPGWLVDGAIVLD